MKRYNDFKNEDNKTDYLTEEKSEMGYSLLNKNILF